MLKVGDKVRVLHGLVTKDDVGEVVSVDPNARYPIAVKFDTWASTFQAVELELIQPEQTELNLEESEQEKTPEEIERDKLRKFFFGGSSEFRPLAKEWKAQGKCPQCGEDGRIHLSTFICSKHGPY